MVSDVATAVSGWVTLRRATIGAGLALATCQLISTLGHPVGDFVDATVLTWSVAALHSRSDRHSRTAVVAAAATAAIGWLAATPVLGDGLPAHVARTALGVLAGSQIYALITHAGRPVTEPVTPGRNAATTSPTDWIDN
jgi:hypothetical protein